MVDRLFGETRGQPGLTCWLAELLSEGFEDYTNDRTKPIGRGGFETVTMAATTALPDARERSVLITQTVDKYEEKAFTVAEMLNWQIQHLEIHIKQILETRKVHGI